MRKSAVSLGLLLACAWSSEVLARPAIANTPPCNSAKVVFSPTSSNEARALAFVKALPGVSHIEKTSNGTYNAQFASPKAVNTLIDDLNQHHAAQVIDLFQFFQCKYGMY
jgi:hypothetical protein